MVAEVNAATGVARPPLLSASSLSKSFPGLRALSDVELSVRSGEIVAVVGQNGSGKSTLVKVLTGVYKADDGARIAVRTGAGDMVELGETDSEIHVIHQDLGLIGSLSTVENLDLGRRLGRRAFIPVHRRAEEGQARALIKRFGSSFDVRLPVDKLSPGERTIVAIARALDSWRRPDQILLLDEPTVALHGDEVQRLFRAVRSVASAGAGVVFISHRLNEVLDLADRVVALRDGRVVADVPTADLNSDDLVALIAGRSIAAAERAGNHPGGELAMSARGIAGASVRYVDLDLRRGEIVGVCGLLGSGREDLAGLLFGAIKPTSGTVKVGGHTLRAGDPVDAVNHGVGFVPADRRAAGAVMGFSVRENLTLPRLRPLQRLLGRLDLRAERSEAADWISQVQVQPAESERRLELFSGGNQQKVVLAKWLRNNPEVLLLDEPTQGVDVGAKATIYGLVDRVSAAGTAVLVSSTDAAELVALCDRVVIMLDGEISAHIGRHELSEEAMVSQSLGRPSEAEHASAGAVRAGGHV